MRRHLIALAVVAAAPAAAAQPAPDPAPTEEPSAPDPAAVAPPRLFEPAPTGPAAPPPPAALPRPASEPAAASAAVSAGDDIGDQAVSAELGLAAGGRMTPGGLRLTGQFLYQLSDRDWFDGAASFTFGSGSGACFRDRQNDLICRHGLTDGAGIEVVASIRHMLTARGGFRPFARVGLGVGRARFNGDDVSGLILPLHGGGGLRVTVADAIAVVAETDLALGVGWFGRGLGAQPQLGFTVAAGVEFRLR